jgi:spore coat protein CotH
MIFSNGVHENITGKDVRDDMQVKCVHGQPLIFGKNRDKGIRLKGNTSRRRPYENGKYHHAHFGLDFHKYVKDSKHTVKGLRQLDLKWFKDDPSYVREIYCYDLFRREGVWTAIRDVYSRLWIKVGEDKEVYFGVYGMKEHIDKNYIRTRKGSFGDIKGNLWKCYWGATLADKNAKMGVDDNHTSYVYELKTNKEDGFDAARAQLQDFIGNVSKLSGSAFDTWISQHMDVDLFLKTYAVNVAVGMWDDYWNNTNNYYLYFSSGEPYQVWFIPYDYDNTLGTSLQCGAQSDSGRQNPLKWGSDNSALIAKILKNQEWKSLYVQYLKELCSGYFSLQSSSARIRTWQAAVSPYVSNDTGEDMEIKDKPASWGNHGEYRILENSSNNFFTVKAQTVNQIK